MNEIDKKNIFSLIVSVLTLAFITIGTTLAFFSTIVRSDEEIEVSSANFKLSAKVTKLYNSNKIIPTNDDDIMKAFDNECIDLYGWGACYAYNIEIKGEGDPQDVFGRLKFTDDELPNLKYLILDADNKDDEGNYLVYKNEDYTNSEYVTIGDAIHLENGISRNLILVVWLSNLNRPQDEETNKRFEGHFTVESTLGTKITGMISAIADNS